MLTGLRYVHQTRSGSYEILFMDVEKIRCNLKAQMDNRYKRYIKIQFENLKLKRIITGAVEKVYVFRDGIMKYNEKRVKQDGKIGRITLRSLVS